MSSALNSRAAAASAAEIRFAHLLLFVAPALWSVNYLVARWAPGVIAPHALALARWCVAVLILAAFCHREIIDKRVCIATEWPHMLGLGALGMWVCGAFVYIGGRDTTAINMGLMYGVTPVLIVFASALFFGERIGGRQGLGVALGLAGVLHVVLRGDWQSLLRLEVNPGDAWISLAVLAWAAYSLLLRAWPTAFSPIARLTLTGCGGVIVLAPFALAEAIWWLPSEVSWKSLGLVLAAALLPGAAAYGAFSTMQRALGVARTSVVQYLGPLYSAGIGWAVLGEQIQAFHGVGALLILPGIWLSTRR
jgi:drug/metabolite transporter (DMT)-like permease